MGSNLLFFGNLSGSEKYTLIIYYRSPYSSKCPLFQDDNWTLIRNYPHPYKWGAGCAVQTVDCNSSSDGVLRDPRMDLCRLSCEFRAAIKMFFVYGCTTLSAVSLPNWIWTLMQLQRSKAAFKGPLGQEQCHLQRPLQTGVGPNRGGGQEGHGCELDKQYCGDSGRDLVPPSKMWKHLFDCLTLCEDVWSPEIIKQKPCRIIFANGMSLHFCYLRDSYL